MATKKCSERGCRKRVDVSDTLCKVHQTNEFEDLKLIRATEVEVLRFCKIDAELRNAMQSMRLLDYEIHDLKGKFQSDLMRLEAAKQHQKVLLDQLIEMNRGVCNTIADKYGLQADKMSIDTETGILRDLR